MMCFGDKIDDFDDFKAVLKLKFIFIVFSKNK